MSNDGVAISTDGAALGFDEKLWNFLRTCQRESVKSAILYSQTPSSASPVQSCLISLPTGAGKSGVITVLSHLVKQKKVLVLCHRRAVCNQLKSDIAGKFLDRSGTSIPRKNVYSDVNSIAADGIYVTTFQMLMSLDAASLILLKTSFDLIIVDEGHSEPSPIWRTLVRGSLAHKIVITATPYRNDLFQFDVSPTSSYVYTFAQALEDHILSEPSWESGSEQDCVQKTLDFLQSNPDLKCIVKCKTFEDVDRYFTKFSAYVPTLAIHERFVNDPRHDVKTSVPKNISKENYKVLVHQHKLDEGIDIPDAKLLLLTYPVGSGRELVQTVGRVVRRYQEFTPLVLEVATSSNFSMWSSYRAFDLSLRSQQGVEKFLASLNTARLIELYLDAFPSHSYHENRFVEKFDLNDFDPDAVLSIPTASVCFFNFKSEFVIEKAADTLYWRAANQGELSKVYKSNSTKIILVLSISFRKSRFLVNELFFEPSLELTLVRQLENSVVAVFDSRGRSFAFDSELHIDSPLKQEQLLKVMTLGAAVRPKEASTRSISSAYKRPESMHIKGKNLDNLGGQQQFSSYRMSTIKCDTLDSLGEKSGSYYVGVDAGRISDQKDRNFSLADLDEWFEIIQECLNSNAEVDSRVMRAFAKPIAVDTSMVADSLILDLTSEQSPIEVSVNGHAFTIDNDFIFYNYKSGFLLSSKIPESKITISLKVEAPYVELHSAYSIDFPSSDHEADFCKFLTSRLHKILFQNGVAYSGGRFFETTLPTQNGFSIANSELAGVVIPFSELLKPGLTEKGDRDGVIKTSNDEFSSDSVFYLIDKLKNCSNPSSTVTDLGPFYPYAGAVDYILCADMGTEPADFILMSPEKVIYVHVKCGESSQRPQSSAGALAEVGSQATKNLEMLITRDMNLKAGNWSQLLSEWPTANSPNKLPNRIRLFDKARFDSSITPVEPALERLWSILAMRRRNIGVRKEIWIVAANSFSVSDFENQMALGAKARPESLQAYQLLQGWISAAADLDAELKIFGSP